MVDGATQETELFKNTKAIEVKIVPFGSRIDRICSTDRGFTLDRAYNFSRLLLEYAKHKKECPIASITLETRVSDYWPVCSCGFTDVVKQLKRWGHYL